MADEQKSKGPQGVLGDLVKAESMVQLALVLPIACAIGGGIGWFLDRQYHTSWMIIAGILMGAVGGFLQIFRLASSFIKQGKK